MMSILDFIRVDVFLTADVRSIAAAETSYIVNAFFVRSLGLCVHDSAANVDAVVRLIEGAHHNLTQV